MTTCSYDGGGETMRCRQPPTFGPLCKYHYHAAARSVVFRHDPYYHDKILRGLISSGWGVFSVAQESAMYDIRAHRDGRPSDQYRKGITEDIESRRW
jgi:hypothetical protein